MPCDGCYVSKNGIDILQLALYCWTQIGGMLMARNWKQNTPSMDLDVASLSSWDPVSVIPQSWLGYFNTYIYQVGYFLMSSSRF